MGFQDIADLDCQVTTAIGGVDKKSGKKNPTTIEGYFIGTRQVPSPKSKTGFAALHVLQTPKGNVGVWGKTNLDQKMTAVKAGQMIRITFTGMVETKNNPMYKYRVQVDPSQTIEVNTGDDSGAGAEDSGEAAGGDESDAGFNTEEGYEPEAELDAEEAPLDEAPVQRPVAPARRAAAPDPQRAAKVQALLKGRTNRSA
jgi:hypothetical protein